MDSIRASTSDDHYGPELRETINAGVRDCFMLQQNFRGYSKIENLVRSQVTATGITESNGFELLRLIRKEFSLMSRSEALGYREQRLKFRVRHGKEHRPDIIRGVQPEIESFGSMLDASFISLLDNGEMSGSVKEITFCCIREICQTKSRNFFSCIRMPRLYVKS